MFYFGVWARNELGHFIFKADGDKLWWPDPLFPSSITIQLDSGFCPETEPYQTQGVAALVHKDGWTVLAFWDRSGDQRPGSNSAFLAEGTFTFGEMVERAKAEFPTIWARFNFPIVEHAEKGA